MRETKTDRKQVHFWMRQRAYNELLDRAQANEVPVSGLLRKYIKKSIADENFVERGGTIIYRSKDGRERHVRR